MRRQRPDEARVRRVLWLAFALALACRLGIFVVPVRVSFGAGSIRCGSAVSPYEGEGLSHPCRANHARRGRPEL